MRLTILILEPFDVEVEKGKVPKKLCETLVVRRRRVGIVDVVEEELNNGDGYLEFHPSS